MPLIQNPTAPSVTFVIFAICLIVINKFPFYCKKFSKILANLLLNKT